MASRCALTALCASSSYRKHVPSTALVLRSLNLQVVSILPRDKPVDLNVAVTLWLVFSMFNMSPYESSSMDKRPGPMFK